MTLAEARENMGAQVAYKYKVGNKWALEHGIITSVNDRYVFVKYGAETNSKATNPADIILFENA